MVFRSITIPSKVLIKANPSTPALITDAAISTISVTSGDNLAIMGSSPPIFLRTLSITALAVSGWHAKTWPRFSTFGQEMFTSIALIPWTARNLLAKTPYSSTLSPAIDTTTLELLATNQGMSFSRNTSMPGPCKPIELSMPLGVSAIRGVIRPVRGLLIMDFVTTAPISESEKN